MGNGSPGMEFREGQGWVKGRSSSIADRYKYLNFNNAFDRNESNCAIYLPVLRLGILSLKGILAFRS